MSERSRENRRTSLDESRGSGAGDAQSTIAGAQPLTRIHRLSGAASGSPRDAIFPDRSGDSRTASPWSAGAASPFELTEALSAQSEGPGGIAASLAAACCGRSPDQARDVLLGLRDGGASPALLIDREIPQAARMLGLDWLADRLSFAQVTIGAARLHALLRELERASPGLGQGSATAPQVAMIVRAVETHTLGAAIAANQLRRRGIAVQLILGSEDAAIVARLAACEADMVMISSSGRSEGRDPAPLIDRLRTATGGAMPLALGGAILEGAAAPDLEGAVDHLSVDPLAALASCGIIAPECQASDATPADPDGPGRNSQAK